MTGRDYKDLIRLHRETKQFLEPSSTENHRQLNKLVNSAHDANLIKYQPVNYDLFKDFIKTRKELAVKSLDKVKKIEDFNKEKKETLFIKNHGIIWLKEWTKLLNQLTNIEAEVETALKFEENSIDYFDFDDDDYVDDNEDCFKGLDEIDEIESYSAKLNDERIVFKVRTIHPIKDLQEDLQYCIAKNAKNLKSQPSMYNEILGTVETVKTQQANIIEKLESEARIAMADLAELTKQINQDDLIVEEGVPSEAFELSSPDEELRLSVLQEFIIIDFKYKEKLRHVDETHKNLMLSKGLYGGWTQRNYEIFQHVYEHYHAHNVTMVNCNFTLRDLMFDRLKKTLDFKADRPMLVKYEEWNNSNKYYQQQKKLIVNEWRESKRSLVVKAEAIFAEAYELIDQQKHRKEERDKQLRVCQELYEKVQRWRNQKLEALEIKQKIDEMIKRQEMERNQFESEQKMRQRMKEKKAIQNYKDRVEALKRQQENIEQERLNRLNRNFSDQSKKDQERIEYRRQVYLDKIAHANAQKEKKHADFEEKEKRKEKFYESVRPNVERDPARMISYTEAELARRGVRRSHDVDDFHDVKPQYNNFSYNEKQINGDARLRIENRLRQAGLINSEYARALVNNVKPPSQPRRDNNANSNWEGFAFSTY